MVQSKSFTLDKSKDTKSKSGIDINNLPWLRWVKFIALLGLMAFILLLILINVSADDNTSKERTVQDVGPQNLQFEETDSPCNMDGCNVSCKNTTDTEIVKFLIDEEIEKCSYSFTLNMEHCEFPKSTIPKKWLEGNYLIKDLSIMGGELKYIEEYAFDTPVFKNLTKLKISNMQIPKLYGKVFSGLDALYELEITDAIYGFAVNSFEPVERTLAFLTVRHVAVLQSPTSFIGTFPLNRTTIVDLRFNNFGSFISNQTFNSLIRVNTLELSNCQINYIGVKTFDKISSTLRYLYLRNNNLTTISGEVFQPLISYKTIFLMGNPWNCDSNLWQLAKYYKESKIFERVVVCDTPEELKGKALDTILHLISTTTTSTTTVIPEPTESTTEYETTESTSESVSTESTTLDAQLFPSTTTDEPCGKENDTDVVVVKCISCTSCILPLKRKELQFSVRAISPSSVQITIEKTNFEFAILWFSDAARNHVQIETNYKDYGLGCRKSVAENVSITDLQAKTSYTFCIIRENDTVVSPFNCQSYYMIGGNICDGYWLLYDSQAVVIVISVIAILLSMLAGAFIMFCVMRCKPTLLKGNNRVLTLSKSKTDVMIMPRKIRGSTDTPKNSANNTASPGSSSLERKYSAASTRSDRSYVTPESLYEVIENKDATAIRKDNFFFERCPKHSPPPLPRRLSSENTLVKELSTPQLPSPSIADYDEYFLTNSRA